MKNFPYLSFVFAALLWAQPVQPSLAREQAQMVQAPGPPPTAPIGSNGHSPGLTGAVVGPNFWQTRGSTANSLNAGTVITGVLQEDISSNKSNAGDVFGVLLTNGAQANGCLLIPPGSKIVGVVKSVTPAKMLRFGQPGSIEISLQSLVLTDGRAIPFHGFIDHNPNLDPRSQPKVKATGPNLSDYGNYAKAFLGQFTAGIGRSMAARHRGADFALKKGELLPIRLSQNLDVPQISAAPYSGNQFSQAVPGQTYREYAPADSQVPPQGSLSPAGPVLRRELASGPPPVAPGSPPRTSPGSTLGSTQGIRATPLSLYDSLTDTAPHAAVQDISSYPELPPDITPSAAPTAQPGPRISY